MTEAGPCVRGGDCSGAGSSLSLSLFWSGGESPLEEGDEDEEEQVREEEARDGWEDAWLRRKA